MTRIIAGFPGVGKSHYELTRGREGSVTDCHSGSFSWLETENGARKRNPAFPSNYIDYIKQNIGDVAIILVSTHQAVTDALVAESMDFTLVYPQRELKDEYLDRFVRRGSSDEFVHILDHKWDEFIDHAEIQSGCKKIVLERGSYLSDVMHLLQVVN